MTRRWQELASILLLAAIYFFAGKFGLSLAFIHANVSAVWPPTGIALAALLLRGYGLWPGIFLGAFFVNITTEGSVSTSVGIAAGNTLEALLGAWLARRFANGVNAFESARNIFMFVLLAAVASTSVSATFGVTSLALGGFARWDRYGAIWLTWWLGDMVGALLVAPLLVILATKHKPRLQANQIAEAFALLLMVVFIGQLVFLGQNPLADDNAPLGYLSLLPLLWAAFRFGRRGAVVTASLTSVIVLRGTLLGLGPFVRPDPNESLLFTQAFMGTVTLTALVLAAVVAERSRAETALREAKDELARANEELQKLVDERTADLEKAKAELLRDVEAQKKLEEQLRQSQKLESIGTLGAGIAHDFNNILNIIKGYASLLSQDRGRKEIDQGLAAIDEAVERGASTVRQLLTLARKSEIELKSTAINDIVAELASLLKQTFPKTIVVAVDLDQQLPPVMADANQIRQALLNLCVNARDAMPNGGGITLRTTAATASNQQDGDNPPTAEPYVCIEVADTGRGMDEGVRSRMFEPFFTTKQTGEGSGLGLSMVYGIVQNNRGWIDVESRRGEGSKFRLYLPAALAHEQLTMDSMLTREDSRQRSAARGTVLVVEDEQHMVQLLSKVLARRGFRVLAALDGEQAIDLYRRHASEIAVVLLDMGLPKIGGLDVMLRMKALNPALKIVVASGHIEPELRAEMHRAGVKEFLYKPYAVDHVADRLESLMAAD